jgi:alkanesulfonate monooxygenase SsuD/methylene tetrahydromethanopterin reductase-like flavin-dependent oxidoreductase (luciferase family)
MGDLKLGWHIGYWGRSMPVGVEDTIVEVERLGFDSVWTAESWGSDVISPLAWWGSRTTKLRLGTNVMQLSARTPAAAAMAAVTMDHLSGGRFCLGLGVSGPQVVEGRWREPASTSTSSGASSNANSASPTTGPNTRSQLLGAPVSAKRSTS